MDFNSILNSYEFKEVAFLAILFYYLLRLIDVGVLDFLKGLFQLLLEIIKFLKSKIKKKTN